MRDAFAEQLFLAIYGSPVLQATLGIDPADMRRPRQAATSLLHRQLIERRIAELKAKMTQGSLREGLVRALIWVAIPRAAFDERGFEAIRRLRAAHAEVVSLAEFKATVRDEFFMLLVDEKAAIDSLPALLPQDGDICRKAFGLLREILSLSDAITSEIADRLRQAATWFGIDPARALDDKIVGLAMIPKIKRAKAS